MGFKVRVVDLGLGVAYGFRVFRGLGLRVEGLGFRVGFKVRGGRFRVRVGLWL